MVNCYTYLPYSRELQYVNSDRHMSYFEKSTCRYREMLITLLTRYCIVNNTMLPNRILHTEQLRHFRNSNKTRYKISSIFQMIYNA